MNCMSVQQEKKSYHRNQQVVADKQNTSSRVGLRSCLRGGVEIEEAECKKKTTFTLILRLLRHRLEICIIHNFNFTEIDMKSFFLEKSGKIKILLIHICGVSLEILLNFQLCDKIVTN